MKIKIFYCCVIASILICSASAGISENRIDSEGDYPSHLQGVCTDGTNIWWSHMVELVRTDMNGKVLVHVKGLRSHHGDLCIANGILYVAVNHGKFNTEQDAESWIYAYKGDDLSFVNRWKVPELRHGAGGMTYKDGHFFVVGGLPPTHNENYVYEYTPEFRFVDRYVLASGWTNLGIQTADYCCGHFFFGCYGGKNPITNATVPTFTLIAPSDFSGIEKVKADTSVGICRIDGRMWRALLHRVEKTTSKGNRRYTVAMLPIKNHKFDQYAE